MRKIKLVAFDCDGVMFDTTAANTSYYNEILKVLGKPLLTDEQFRFAHVHTVDESLVYLLDGDEAALKKAHAHRKTMTYHPFIKYMVIEPSLKPLLKKLRPHYKTAVATNRSDTMDSVLAEHGLITCFDMVVTSLDVKHPKPHPESLIKILNYFQLEPDEAYYVGDSELDERAALGAGIPFIAYDNPALNAAHHIKSLGEIEFLVDRSS